MRRLIMMFCVIMCLLGGVLVHAGVQEETPGKPSSEQPAQEPQKQNKVQAWNAYADLSFTMDRGFWASYQKYFSLMGTKAQVVNPGAEKLRSFALEMPNDDLLHKSIPKALAYATQGTGELDTTVAALAKPLQKLWEAMLDLSNYVKNKDYMDDDYAKLQQFHTIIMENRAAVDAEIGTYYAAMQAQQRRNRQENIDAMRAKGIQVMPALMDFVAAAHDMNSYFMANNITGPTLQSMDIETFRPLYTRLVEAAKTFGAFEHMPEVMKKEGHVGMLDLAGCFYRVSYTKAAASAILENYMEKKKMGKKDSGTPYEFAERVRDLGLEYNHMIDYYNKKK